MKRTKILICSAVLVLCVSAFTAPPAAAAAKYNTPAGAVAGLTGKTMEEISRLKQTTGKTFGAIAAEEGKLEEFKKEMLEIKKDRIQENVDSGKITRQQADETISRVKENQANCDGTGNSSGKNQSNGNGTKQGNSNGQGRRNGGGQGNGSGRGGGGGGKGLRDGSCVN